MDVTLKDYLNLQLLILFGHLGAVETRCEYNTHISSLSFQDSRFICHVHNNYMKAVMAMKFYIYDIQNQRCRTTAQHRRPKQTSTNGQTSFT